MYLQEMKISDSARLWTVRTDKFKKNILSMSAILPLGPGTTPLDLLFPKVLVRGTAGYPSNASLRRRLEELYDARIAESGSYFGNSLKVGFTADFLDDKAVGSPVLEGVIALLADIWQRPALDSAGLLRENEVNLAKRAMRDAIRAEINNTAVYAANRCREIMCAGEPHGYSVTEAEVEEITATGLTERYQEVRDSAYLTFFYIGPKPADKVAELLTAAFPPAPCCTGMQRSDVTPSPDGAPVCKEVSMPVSQAKLVMGFTIGGMVFSDSPEYYAMCLATEIFGGTPSSKLFVNLRERLSLCYYCGAYYENLKGIIYVSSGIDTKSREAARAEVLAQLDELRAGHITASELDAALLSIVNSYRQIEDSPYSILSFCFGRGMLGLDCSPENFIKRIGQVTIDDIKKAAERIRLRAEYFLAARGGEAACDE
ncbi:MAG: M16 family metallopeptidase [Eubacteriales bacterium]|jgi:predicted Zn-dependent peptidase